MIDQKDMDLLLKVCRAFDITEVSVRPFDGIVCVRLPQHATKTEGSVSYVLHEMKRSLEREAIAAQEDLRAKSLALSNAENRVARARGQLKRLDGLVFVDARAGVVVEPR